MDGYIEHKTCDTILPYLIFAKSTEAEATIFFPPFQQVHGQPSIAKMKPMPPNRHGSNDKYDNVFTMSEPAEVACQLKRFLKIRYYLQRRDMNLVD